MTPVTPRHFAWQAWDLVTSTLISRGRRGTISHPRSFCVAGTALTALDGALGPGLVVRDACDARDAAALCIAGVGLGDIHLDFTWQAWHNHTNFTYNNFTHTNLTYNNFTHFCVAGVGLGDIHLDFTWQACTITHPRSFCVALCVAGVGLGDIHLDFTWQAWHNLTSTVVLRGRRLTHGTATVVLRGRRLTHGTGWRPWARFSRA